MQKPVDPLLKKKLLLHAVEKGDYSAPVKDLLYYLLSKERAYLARLRIVLDASEHDKSLVISEESVRLNWGGYVEKSPAGIMTMLMKLKNSNFFDTLTVELHYKDRLTCPLYQECLHPVPHPPLMQGELRYIEQLLNNLQSETLRAQVDEALDSHDYNRFMKLSSFMRQ